MKIRKHVRDVSGTPIVTTSVRYDGIRFYKSIYPAGAQQDYIYYTSVPYNTSFICQIQPTGTMVEPTGTWPDRTAGWISREDEFMLPEGLWSRVATEDSVLWCCLGRFEDEDLGYVTPLRLTVGDEVELATGQSLFLVQGAVSINGTEHNGERRLKASGPRTATVTQAGFAFMW